MAIEPNDLRRKAKLGDKTAERILPLRKRTHLTLASILLINVAAVSATSLVLETRFNGWIAGAASTILIVLFGEVLPQAIFAKNAIGWTGRLAPLLRLFTIVAYPISRPLELLLDKIVGKAPRRLHGRHELGMLISEHLGAPTSELDEDEVAIIRGALLLSEKHVSNIITPIDEVYWLQPTTKLTNKRIDEIKAKGYSRIPIFNKKLSHCYGVLLMKDLIDVDFNYNNYSAVDMPLYPVEPIDMRTALDTTFRKFIDVHAHLIPVANRRKLVGIATMEDLVEEILDHEIIDETDFRKHRS